MMLLFRISIQLSVESLIATRSATPSTLDNLPEYFYIITERIHRSVYTLFAICNDKWLKFRKAI